MQLSVWEVLGTEFLHSFVVCRTGVSRVKIAAGQQGPKSPESVMPSEIMNSGAVVTDAPKAECGSVLQHKRATAVVLQHYSVCSATVTDRLLLAV